MMSREKKSVELSRKIFDVYKDLLDNYCMKKIDPKGECNLEFLAKILNRDYKKDSLFYMTYVTNGVSPDEHYGFNMMIDNLDLK